MQGVSRRVAMLFVMIIVYFDRKDTPFQRIAQLFHLFFRLLTGERSFSDKRAEGQKRARAAPLTEEHASPTVHLHLKKTAQKWTV